MSFGDRLGLGGLVVALIGIAVVYLWPDKKWIGWLSLLAAVFLVAMWAWLEFRIQIFSFYQNYPVKSTLAIFMCGGILSVSIWLSLVHKPPSTKNPPSSSPPHEQPHPQKPPQAPKLEPGPIQVLPAYGDLGERAIRLSLDIMGDLHRNGWPLQPWEKAAPGYTVAPMTLTGEPFTRWEQQRSMMFRFRFLKNVINIRDEFAQVHIHNEDVDSLVNYAQAMPGGVILVLQIQKAAKGLEDAATKIPAIH